MDTISINVRLIVDGYGTLAQSHRMYAHVSVIFLVLVSYSSFDVSGGQDCSVGGLLERIPTYCSHVNQIWCQH